MTTMIIIIILTLLRCDNGTESIGCGPQEEFRACADLAIHSSSGKCHRTNSSNGYMCQRRNWLIHKADFVLCTVSQFCNAIQMMQSTLPKAGGKILFQIESKLTQSKLNQMLDTHTVQLYIWQKSNINQVRVVDTCNHCIEYFERCLWLRTTCMDTQWLLLTCCFHKFRKVRFSTERRCLRRREDYWVRIQLRLRLQGPEVNEPYQSQCL